MKEFIVLECHGGAACATICLDEDGDVLVFHNEKEAQDFANNECQDGRVIEV